MATTSARNAPPQTPEPSTIPATTDGLVELLEPGDLVFGQGSQPISRVIRRLSGTWSHVGMYIGQRDIPQAAGDGIGKGMLPAHSVAEYGHQGPLVHSLTAFVERYNGRVGFARLDSDRVKLAADEAWNRYKEFGERHPDHVNGAEPKFGYQDLGLAAAVLIRAKLRKLSSLFESDEERQELVDELGEPAANGRPFHWRLVEPDDRRPTCAGFVFDVLRSAGVDITPSFIDHVGVTRSRMAVFEQTELTTEDGLDDVSLARACWLIDESSASMGYGRLDYFGPARTDIQALLLTEHDDRLAVSKLLNTISVTVPNMMYFMDPRAAIPVPIAVGPNDLWRSTSLTRRGLTTKTTAP